MPLYTYHAINSSGVQIKGSLNADSIIQAKQKIKSGQMILTKIQEQTSSSSKSFSLLKIFKSRISVEDVSLMTRQLSTLIKAKVQLVDALSALIDQTENEELQIILAQVRQSVNEGSSLAKSLKNHPKIFNHIYINMVDAGEASGRLDVVLLRLADFTEAQVRLRSKLRSAMTYPTLMAVFGFAMFNLIFILVIPRIARIFESTKKELPLQTKICIEISNFLQSYWWLVLITIVISFTLFKKYISTKSGTYQWHKIQMRLPILSGLIKMINVSRFCSTLTTLLNSGVPILASLNIVKNLISNTLMKDAIENARNDVSEGLSMAGALKANGHYPAIVTHMISIGEKTGELGPMLHIISQNYEQQLESKISGLTSILEPIMMVVIGLMTGFIVFSVIAPMMNLNSLN